MLFEASSSLNADFRGNNGEEYLEKDAKKEEFENNFDFYFNKYKGKVSSEELIMEIANRMCSYTAYECDIIYDDNYHIMAIAICIEDTYD